jgi:hypothetical protein
LRSLHLQRIHPERLNLANPPRPTYKVKELWNQSFLLKI